MLKNLLRRFAWDISGGVAIYATFMTMLLVGTSGLVVDYGRMAVLKNQMQKPRRFCGDGWCCIFGPKP